MSLDEMQARCDAAKYKPHSITFTDRVSCGAVDRMSAAIVYDERGTPMFIVPRQAGTSDDMRWRRLDGNHGYCATRCPCCGGTYEIYTRHIDEMFWCQVCDETWMPDDLPTRHPEPR